MQTVELMLHKSVNGCNESNRNTLSCCGDSHCLDYTARLLRHYELFIANKLKRSILTTVANANRGGKIREAS